jgi:hypothetical protein
MDELMMAYAYYPWLWSRLQGFLGKLRAPRKAG